MEVGAEDAGPGELVLNEMGIRASRQWLWTPRRTTEVNVFSNMTSS